MNNLDQAHEQAIAQASSIAAMVAALNVDYERLEELREERADLQANIEDREQMVRAHDDSCMSSIEELKQDVAYARKDLADWETENADELRELEEAANGNTSEDQAREAIQADALDVQVRSDWHAPGSDDNKPTEFMILLCTGGPACRIMGELNSYGEPTRAWIEYQDWSTPWTHAVGVIDQDTLLTYCQQFYFGE